MNTRSTRRSGSADGTRSESANGTTEEKVRSSSLESLRGQARLETRVSVLSDEAFRKLLRAGVAQEGLKIDLERETAILSDNKESRTFFFKRFRKKGITEEVWEWFLAHPEDMDVAVEASESESTSVNGSEVMDDRKISQKAKALESFGRAIKVKAQSLDPAKTYTANFRRVARDLESKIKGHVQLLGTSMEWGYNYFRASLSLAARKRIDDYFGEELGEEPDYEERLNEAVRYLCDETSESKFRRNYEDEFRRLERKNYKFVDTMSSSYVRLRSWFPGIKPDFEDQRLDFERLLKKHRFAKELQLAMLDVSFNGDYDSMVSFLRQREKILAESFLPKAPYVQKKKWEVSSVCTEYLMGRCKKGKDCHKKHEGKPICRFFYKKGTCRFGDKCKYRHVKELPGEKKGWKLNKGKSLGIDAGDMQHEAAKDKPKPDFVKKEKEVTWDELSLELTAVNLAELAESMSKPYEEDPTLRRRRKALVYLEGSKGVFKGKALVDSGSQPTSVHVSVLQRFKKLGIPFTFAAKKQYTRSFNGGVNETLGEATFQIKFREAKSKSSYIKAKIWAIVIKAAVTHDFLIGMDMQNLYSMAVHGNPDPKLRRLTVSNKEIESQPCSQKGEGYIISELKVLSSELPEMWDVNKLDMSNNREAAKAISTTLPTFESLVDAPDQRLHKAENSYQFITGKEARKGVSRIIGVTTFPDQSATTNKDVTEDPVMVSLLDRIENEIKCGNSMMDTKEQFWYIRFILCRFQRVFVKELSRCGGFRSEPYNILPWLKPGVKPLRQQPYRLPPDKLITFKEAVKQLCDANVFYKVDNTDIKWASPGFPVWDKGKTIPRVVVAMQKLNDLCKLQYNVAPITEVTLMRVLNSLWNVYSDAKGGYRQIPCTIMTQRIFTMVVLWGAFASNSLPMGYKNSVQIFCERMDEMCSELKDTVTHVDDITNMGVNYLAGCLEFTKYLSKCEERNLKLSAKKLQVFPRRARILGLLKEGNTYKPDPKRYTALDQLQTPVPGRKFKSSIRRIIGLFIYYLKFIPNFWDIAYPIKELLKEGAKAEWKEHHEEAFCTLKQLLKESSLTIPKFTEINVKAPFIVDSDASDVAGAGTLSQMIEGKERLIACHSFAFSTVQMGWTISRKEMYTPLRLFDKWAMWLGGFPIKLRKDSRCAIWLVKHGQDKMREPWTRMSAAYDPWMIVKHEYRQRDLHVNPDTFTYESKEAKTTSKYAARKTLRTLFPDQHRAAEEYLKGYKEGSRDDNLEIHPTETLAIENKWGLPLTGTSVWEISDVTHETNSIEASIRTTVLPDKNTLREEQRRDFAKHFAALENADNKNHELVKSQYRIEGELLHKIGSFEVGGAVPLLTCVPKEYRLRVLDAYHVDNLSNHRNATDLAARVLKSYYWPGLNRECRAYVKGCQVCIRAKTKLKKLPYAQNKYTSIMDAISLDAIGRVSGKKHYVLTCSILSIGYLIAKATKTLNARKAADFLLDVVTTYGVPRRIITDWGTEFVNKIFKHLANRLRHRHVKISVKNSQGNSDLERKHRAHNEGVLSQLIQNVDAKGNWADYLKPIVFAINTLTNTRGYSPAMLLLGFQPELFPDMETKQMRGHTAEDRRKINDIDARLSRIQHARVLFATLRDEAKFNANFKRNASLKTKYADYGVGDHVWLYREDSRKSNPVTNKYDLKKTGPVVIVSVNRRSNTYRVVDERTGYCATVHAKYLSPLGRFRVLPEVEEVSSDEESSDSSPSESSSTGEENEDVSPALEGKRTRRPAHHGPHMSS